jgi:hypothetical protein
MPMSAKSVSSLERAESRQERDGGSEADGDAHDCPEPALEVRRPIWTHLSIKT